MRTGTRLSSDNQFLVEMVFPNHIEPGDDILAYDSVRPESFHVSRVVTEQSSSGRLRWKFFDASGARKNNPAPVTYEQTRTVVRIIEPVVRYEDIAWARTELERIADAA